MEFPEFIRKLPMADMPPGIKGWLLLAPRHQVAFLQIPNDSSVPEHFHAAQLEIPLEGSADVTIGGVVKTYGRGESFYVPAGIPHSAKVKGPYAAVIIFDSPDRYAVRK